MKFNIVFPSFPLKNPLSKFISTLQQNFYPFYNNRHFLTATTNIEESGLHWTSTFLPRSLSEVLERLWLMIGTHGLT